MAHRIFDGVLDLVGGTPLVRLPKLRPEGGAEVLGKLESANPAGSVKDRPALWMIRRAEREGKLKPGATIVEATSGNTGISLAMICAVRGYRCAIIMPEDMSQARRDILKAYGAEVVLTPAEEGMAGAVEKAEAMVRKKDAFWVGQFDNPANPEAHAETTAEEIWEATGGELDAFVAGVGTGGTLTGVGRVLRERKEGLRLVAVEPRASAVLSGGKPGLHGIQGLGAGFVPEVLDESLIDDIVTVTDLAADRMMRRLAREEGLLLGPSAGANVHAAREVARRMEPGQRVVTILCDTGERYFS
ncbi:MAG TPA: cysteine synthase A [Polyangiaceae bacterium LLY-WYZ-15_(1-7)]|nr:cysteine synthase A [Myxococcales bacterium]MAT26016.1 cysteine synthase A [Sandaracinus sp.]HJK90581.1 cysteine synthase A [Polyangiaceae bacterium LLY-WYZ-15_(1-7)]MBJ75051.1 cysteine synthase A [Sandaracinus sp.]HJL03195.1 cysteine synthase A [Polyangiaceae bacterium LLY-WYZ-15_(1-7)]